MSFERVQHFLKIHFPVCIFLRLTMNGKTISTKELELAQRRTEWKSVYTVGILLLFLGMQLSIYFTSTWQYLSESDETATVDFFGYILALMALSTALANPVLGYWNQVSESTRNPLFFAYGVAALGNFIYALSYLANPYAKWAMLFSRILCGIGPGALGVLRSFVANASTKEDRMRAVSLTNSGFTCGFFLGPTIQIGFIPLGKEGINVGFMNFNMYTSCAIFMGVVSLLAIVLTYFFLEENYIGIVSSKEKTSDPYFVLPKYDRLPAVFLFYVWWLMCGVVCVESMAAPLTIAMFNWSHETAVFYNGLIQTVSCTFTFLINFLIASTRLKNVDQRVITMAGLLFFLAFFTIHMPWPFYPGPLDRPNKKLNMTAGEEVIIDGLCDFDWCDYTPRVPIGIYLFITSVVIGCGFPLIGSGSSALLSQILGPRKQGVVQGLFASTGSFSQFFVSLFSTRLFEMSGYKWIMFYHFSVVSLAILGVALLWKRLVPLKMTPKQGQATKYKLGTFYRM
ncbi:unnamed protein product [Caenorhabditis bovis]|uniref:Major facilitator superfamily (MFS) profile domain-containing protein n=1 Tax=Caenorhabditis bovis TaxID=2654633 RepID=A0A8S1FET7_9PELO|nr:unnamed protein product [Caenorhabditis bovis]